MRERLYAFLLGLYRQLPRPARRRLVRAVAPSYTVGAICVLERADGAILLVKQAYRDNWGVPGGLLNRREEPADAVRREVFEEVGLTIELVGEPAVVVDTGPQRIDIIYRARPVGVADADAVTPRSPEIREARWFPVDALPELQFETADALVVLARASTASQVQPLLSELSALRRPTR
jgi:8-oxo-dGTP diphosphatase